MATASFPEIPAGFATQRTGNLLLVRTQGHWDLPMTMKYFTALSDEIRKFQMQPWGLLVDMRGWTLAGNVMSSMKNIRLDLDRRNQLVECWIVDSARQQEQLSRLPEKSGIVFQRVPDLALAVVCLRSHRLQPEVPWESIAIPGVDDL